MRWKRSLLVVLLVLLVLPLALAADTIVLTAEKNQITTAEEGTFTLKITNEGRDTKTYKVYSLELGWIIDPLPRDRTFELAPRESKETTIRVKPLEAFKPGAYAPTLYIDSYLGAKYWTHTESLKLYVSPEGPVDYLPSIKVDIDMDEKINPRNPVSIKLFLENRNPLDLDDLTIKMQSEMPQFEKEVSVSLPPLQKKTVEFSVIPDKYQQPKDYTLFFVFERKGQTVKVIEKNIQITELLPDFAVATKQEKIYLKTFSEVTATNEGNVRNTQDVKIPLTYWESFFLQSDGVVRTEEGQKYLVWSSTLGPEESTVFNYVISYRLLLYVAILLALFLAFYFYVKSPLEVIKKATTTKSDQEGAVSEIKIVLEVKNSTSKVIKDVKVVDIVPAIANVEKSLELGTLKPKDVKHTKRGTQVVWQLAEVDGHEHRLITYKVKAKLNILGTFSLPRATVRYKRGKTSRKAYSNQFRLKN